MFFRDVFVESVDGSNKGKRLCVHIGWLLSSEPFLSLSENSGRTMNNMFTTMQTPRETMSLICFPVTRPPPTRPSLEYPVSSGENIARSSRTSQKRTIVAEERCSPLRSKEQIDGRQGSKDFVQLDIGTKTCELQLLCWL